MSSGLERREQAWKTRQRQNWNNVVTNLMSHVREGVSKGKSQTIGLRDWREMVVSLAEVDNSEDKLNGRRGGRKENAFLQLFFHSFVEQLFFKPYLVTGESAVDKISSDLDSTVFVGHHWLNYSTNSKHQLQPIQLSTKPGSGVQKAAGKRSEPAFLL